MPEEQFFRDLNNLETRLTQWLIDKIEGKADKSELRDLRVAVDDLRESALRRVGPFVDELDKLMTRVEAIEKSQSWTLGGRTVIAFMFSLVIVLAGIAVPLIIHYL